MSQPYSGQGALLDNSGSNAEWVIRSFREDDLKGIVALINAVDEAYKLDEGTSVEALRVVNASPRSDPPRQVIVVEGPHVEGVPPGVFIGSGRINYEDDESANLRMFFPNVVVHPAAQGMGLERVIAERLLEIARGYGNDPALKPVEQVTVKAYVPEELHAVRDMWESLGLKEVRQFWDMARPLHEPIDEPAPVEGVVIRTYRNAEDHIEANRAFNNSFSDHYDHHEVPQEDWDYWSGTPNTRLDLSWVAEDEAEAGRIVGFCIIAISEENNKRRNVCEGWIELLGTTGDWRRKGLGRALLLHGLHSLKSAGMDTAMLGVDSLSLTGANRLYESVGFRTRSRDVLYEGNLSDLESRAEA